MTKLQKIWMWLSLAMFLVPEVLWSPIANYSYTFFQNNNSPKLLRTNVFFGSNDDFHLTLTIITLIQFIGLLTSAILVFKFAKFRFKNILGIILLVLAGWAFFIFYLLWATLNFLS